MDARNLIETLKGRGLSLHLDGGQIKVEASQEPNLETRGLIDELRQHREEALRILSIAEPRPRAWIVEEVRGDDGETRAVLICSAFLEDNLWFVLDPTFTPPQGFTAYSIDDLPALRAMTREDLKQLHQARVIFPGRWRRIGPGEKGQST